MSDKVRLGISACLLGQNVRYDGGHKLDHFLADTLGRFVEWVPVCPEVECGLPAPREPMRLVGDPESPRLVTTRSGIDHTERMLKWAGRRVAELERENLNGFVFKSRSPSSGFRGVKIYSREGMPGRTGSGLFARAFMDRFPLLPVEDEGRLNDPGIRENFIERVFVHRSWASLLSRGPAARDLVAFHGSHKYLLMAHSPEHLRRLGRIVAAIKGRPGKDLCTAYGTLLMEALKKTATPSKNANVLEHLMGYFKKTLTPDEKQELVEVIGSYRRRFVPLIVPITLLRHYVRKYDEPYLRTQVYLDPHPLELMLRNHA